MCSRRSSTGRSRRPAGYLAALYKRVTIAVADGKFEDGARLARLDAGFASRYFDALSGHFHPGRFPRPTHS